MDSDALVGRASVLALLSAAVATGADHGDAVLFLGDAGIGKTACLRAAEGLARRCGHRLLGTAGNESETHLPFAGLHRLLRPLLGSTHTLPEVQRRALLTALGMHEGGTADPFVVSVATLNLLREASQDGPLVITADDVQWLDQETRHILAFATRRLDRDRVLVVGTSSSLEAIPDFHDIFRDVRLEPLDDQAAHLLLAHRAPGLDRDRRQWVVSLAAGNPLALVELARTAPAIDGSPPDPLRPVPALTPTLERAFAGRWPELPAQGRDVALVAAVSSDPGLQEILAATAKLSSHPVSAAALELPQSLGLLRFDETRVHFTHPLVKTAIAQKEPLSRRQAAHRALGAVITASSSRRAWHRALGTAERDDDIAAELEAATAESLRHDDTAAAITALERAAQLSTSPGERGRRLLLAAGHASRRGQPGLVLRLLEVAASSELSTFDRVRAELLREDFEGVVLADSQRVVHLCGLGRRAVEAGESDLALDLAYAAARLSCASAVDAQVRTEVSSLAGRLARDSTDARAVAALALADPVGHGRAVLSMLTDLDQDRAVTGDALAAYAAAARAVGDYVLASSLIDRAETDFRARGLLGPLARTLCIAADLRLDLGDWDRSAAAREEFSHLGGASMSASHQAFARATTAKGAALRGDIDTALELVSDAEHSPAARSGTSQRARMQIARGLAHISSGRHGEAFSALRRVFEPDDACHHFREQFDAIAYLAESAVRTGNQDQARVVLQRLQPVAHASRSPVLSTQMDYAAAVLASDDAAEPLFLAALSADSAAAPWPRARLQLAYGCWLRRQHRVTQSRGPLQSSLSIFQQLGATRWAEEAGAELNASGVQPEAGRDAPVPPLLSAQEWKIARLAAQGLSNRQIGEQLYLSPRTVGSHLYRIFPKLGVTARGQIALRLDEEHAVRPDR